MFRFHPLMRGGARRYLWVAVATVAVLLATAAPVQAGQSAYVTDAENVFQYDIVAGGLLVPMTPAKVAAGDSPTSMAVSPDFESLYAANNDSHSVSQYDIGPGGELSPKSPPTVTAGFAPKGVAVSPNGQSVYVTAHGRVSQYNVDAAGELSPKSPASVASAPAAYGVVVSPDGQSVYVTDMLSNTDTYPENVWQYDVGPGGALSPKEPPTVTAAIEQPWAVAVSPDGQTVYVTNWGLGSVSQFDVGPGGALSLKSPATVAAGYETTEVAVSPDGESVYVISTGEAGSVFQYHVGADGLLVPMDPAKVAASEGPHGVAVSPDGESVYVANTGWDGSGGRAVSQYDVGESGKLSPKTPATVASGPYGGGAVGVAVTPGLVPTAKKQCKDGGWRKWGFKKRGRCIPFVKREARRSCRAARKVIGRHAFREEYGNKHHRRAQRRCIKEEIGTR